MKKQILALLLVAIACVQCNKTSLDIDDITSRVIDGFITPGTVPDNTDWRLTDQFTSAEASLFGASTAPVYCPQPANDSLFLYPNPNSGIFYIYSTFDTTDQIQLRIVRKDMSLVKAFDVNSREFLAFDISNLVNDGEYVRAYYRIINPSGCEFRGHGDIKIKK